MSTLVTYNDTSRPEDLTSIVTNISPNMTPLLSTLGRGNDAKQTLHEYLVDSFSAGAHNAAVEGAAFSSDVLVAPTRATNVTQIVQGTVEISGTQQVVSDPSALQYQVKKKLTEHAKNIETALMGGSQASGATNAARQMTGVINALTTNATTQASDSTLTEDGFNDLLALTYASTDQLPDSVYVGAVLKRTISGFTGGNTKNLNADDKKITNSVDVYEGDFGIQKIMLHRDVPSAAAGRTVVGINSDYHKLSWLRPTNVVEISKVGDSDRKQIISELTMEHTGEATGFVSNRYQG
jgi:hypothetical protein